MVIRRASAFIDANAKPVGPSIPFQFARGDRAFGVADEFGALLLFRWIERIGHEIFPIVMATPFRVDSEHRARNRRLPFRLVDAPRPLSAIRLAQRVSALALVASPCAPAH